MIYEVVTGQVLLHKRDQFYALHSEVLLPLMREHGIAPELLLITDIGRYLRFLDIYRYENMSQYDSLTSQLIADPRMVPYYEKVGQCIQGSITVELMSGLPYSYEWVRGG